MQLLAQRDAGTAHAETSGLGGDLLQLSPCDHQPVYKPFPCFLTRRDRSTFGSTPGLTET